MTMNLATDPWIPVVFDTGCAGFVSLRGAFARGMEIRDLSARPHERVALMRLLLCVAHAALDGPEDEAAWVECGKGLPKATADYLAKWKHAFELFGDGPRFLQIPDLHVVGSKDEDEGNSVSKLDLALATGNNTTLFDNAGGGNRGFADAQLAVMLLSFQCFSPGGRIGVAKWAGKETPGKGSSNHAPCAPAAMLHALLRGPNLLETVRLNLITRETVEAAYGAGKCGRPVWETMPGTATDQPAVANATKSYLGRLVPLSRAILLAEDRRTMILANGLAYPSYPEWREAMATVVVREVKNKQERFLLGASPQRGIWRELHSLTVRRLGGDVAGPLSLQNISSDQSVDLWAGCLATDKAKVLDTLESVFHIPAAMFADLGRKRYENGVAHASAWAGALRFAVGTCLEALKVEPDRITSVRIASSTRFWTAIETRVPLLLEIAANPARLGPGGDYAASDWGRAVRRAAREAYEFACAHDTPRQLEAFAKGLRRLRLPPNIKPNPKAS